MVDAGMIFLLGTILAIIGSIIGSAGPKTADQASTSNPTRLTGLILIGVGSLLVLGVGAYWVWGPKRYP